MTSPYTVTYIHWWHRFIPKIRRERKQIQAIMDAKYTEQTQYLMELHREVAMLELQCDDTVIN